MGVTVKKRNRPIRCICPTCGAAHTRKKGTLPAADPERNRQIFRFYDDGRGMTQAEIGERYDLTPGRVSAIIKQERARDALRVRGH